MLSPRASKTTCTSLLPLMWILRGAQLSIQPWDSKAHVYPPPPHVHFRSKLSCLRWIWRTVKPHWCPQYQLYPRAFLLTVVHRNSGWPHVGTPPSRWIINKKNEEPLIVGFSARACSLYQESSVTASFISN